MGWYNTAKTHLGATMDTAGTWAKNKGSQISESAMDYGSQGASKWRDANALSSGFLNPTAVGMGVGGAVGGTVGAASDNGSFLGGFAGGAMLGGAVGAGGYAGLNKYKFSQYTNPIYSNQSSAWAPGVKGPSSAWAPGARGPNSAI